MEKSLQDDKKALKKEKKLKEKDEKYLKKYGIKYTEVSNSFKSKKDKKSDKKKERANLKIFIKYFTKHKLSLFACVVLSIISIGLSFSLLPCVQAVMDFASIGEWTKSIIAMVIVSGLTVIMYLSQYLQSIVFGSAGSKAVFDLRHDLAVKALNTESKSYKLLSSGEIVYRVSSEPNDFLTGIRQVYDNFVSVLATVGYFLYFATTNYLLAICMLVVLIVSSILVKYQLKISKINGKRSKILNERLNSNVNEFVRGSDDVKSLNLKNSVLNTCDKWIRFRKNGYFDSVITDGAMRNSRAIIEEIFVAAGLILSLYLVGIGQIPFSLFVLFFFYRKTPVQLTGGIFSLLDATQKVKISSERMGKLYNEEIYSQEKFGDKELENFTGKIELKDVTFSYGDEKALENISFVVPAKHTLGIVGKSGAGKSTILGLINRLYDCDSGEILLDGVNNKELSEQSLRGNISLVPQMPYIFNTTIRENLSFAKPDATETEMIEVLKKAQFYDFVMSKPDGLDMVVGEGGVILSGGQRQRLALARAFLTNSKLIMLDEATSALDNQNQEGIKNVINDMKNDCSFIIVAHRLSTIIDCDEIVVLDGHEIIARGTHQDLIKNCPIYSDLYKLEKQRNEN